MTHAFQNIKEANFNRFVSFFCLLTFGWLQISCSSETETECKLASAEVKALNYDLARYVVFSPQFSGKIRYEYDGGRLSKVLGGPTRNGIPGDVSQFVFRDDVVANVFYSGDTIHVEDPATLPPSGIPVVNSFVIIEGKLQFRREKIVYPYAITNDYTYEWNDDIVIERKNGSIFRMFFLEDGNLIKIEQIIYGLNGISGKTETTFSEYLGRKNPLKGKFHYPGALYTAFSDGNYGKRRIAYYLYENGDYVYDYDEWWLTGFNLNSDGIAELFEIVCD